VKNKFTLHKIILITRCEKFKTMFSGEELVEILIAANEYQSARLRELCEIIIEESVDVQNAAWLFEIAHVYN